MPKDPRLMLRANIPDKSSAIAVGGGAGDQARLILDVCVDDPDQLVQLLGLRGERLIVTIIKEDDLPRNTQ